MFIESILTIILEEEMHNTLLVKEINSTLLNIYIGIGAILAGIIIFIAEGYTRDLEQGRILYRISNIMPLLIVYFMGLCLLIIDIEHSQLSISVFYLFYIVGYSIYLLHNIYTIYNTLKLKTRYNKALLETFDDNITSFLDEIKQTYPTDIDIDIPTLSPIDVLNNKQSHKLISHQEGYIKSIDVEGIKKLNTGFRKSDAMSIGRAVNKRSTLGYFDIEDKDKKDDIEDKLRSAFTIEEDENIDNVISEIDMIKSTFIDAIKDKKDDIIDICRKKYIRLIKLLNNKKINTNIYIKFIGKIKGSYIDYIKEYINTGNTIAIKPTLRLAKDIYIALLEAKQYKLLDDSHRYPLYKCTEKVLDMIKNNNNDSEDVLDTIIYTYINEIKDALQLEIDKNKNNIEAINALETLTTRAIACVLEPILDTIKELYDIDKTKYKTTIEMLIDKYNGCRAYVLETIKHNEEDVDMQLFYHNGYLLYRNCDDIKELIGRYIKRTEVDVNTLMKYFIVFFKENESYMYDHTLYTREPLYNNEHHAYIYATRYFIAQALYILGQEENTPTSDYVKKIISDTIKTEYDKEIIKSVIAYTNGFLEANIKETPYPTKIEIGAQGLCIIRENYTLEDMKSDFRIVNSVRNIEDSVINTYRDTLIKYLTTLYNDIDNITISNT